MNEQVLANTAVETLVDVPIDVAVNEYGRDGAVWREVWRAGARGEDWGLLDGAVRRDAYGGYGGDWADQAGGGGFGFERGAAGGGGDGDWVRWMSSGGILRWRGWWGFGGVVFG